MDRACVRTSANRSLRRVLTWQLLLMAVTAAAFVAAGRFRVRPYFVLSYVGLVTVILVAGPDREPPRGWGFLRVAVLVGGLAFGYLLALEFAAVG